MKQLYFALNDVSPETLDKLMVVFWIALGVAVVMLILTIVVWLRGRQMANKSRKAPVDEREPIAVPTEPVLQRSEKVDESYNQFLDDLRRNSVAPEDDLTPSTKKEVPTHSDRSEPSKLEKILTGKTQSRGDRINDADISDLRNELRKEKIERMEDVAKRYEKHSLIAKAFCIVFVVLISISAANCFNSIRFKSFVSNPTDWQQSYSPTVGSTYRFVYVIGGETESYMVLSSDAKNELESEAGQQIAIWIGVSVASLIGIAATCSISSQALQKVETARMKVRALQKEIRESTSK